MITKDFQYISVMKAEDGVKEMKRFEPNNLQAYYFAGGTEIITFSRKGHLSVDSVIDIKNIEGISSIARQGDEVIIGAGASLTKVAESNIFPLLTKTVQEIADHTNQNKITIGGNVCGQIHYREAVLPLLLADSSCVLVGEGGYRRESIHNLFNGKLNLLELDLLLHFELNHHYAQAPFYHSKITKMEKVDYPIITVAALKINEKIRIAFSGLCYFPFRSEKIEQILNTESQSISDKIRSVLKNIPFDILDDQLASSEYRKFVLSNELQNTILHLKGEM
ncbi:FAD binding domain-containing protein [Lederbergia panacisoli]|uniref:FAD binding domain-containing protein n=1 Tax=Lederbergia panacisoli TaxID=1255251 RepID=UPI00214C1FBE|nr:FAD binding domain-containing protein [Lederbergia panacisoli]MCR2821597.1 FAD binding domain-containing protein [Lederbergia panacisoli]